ncbi:hypothetical protein [Actinoplanes sp. GCM10030250]|uniref:hypothetical protein n=1 Tax=Actinoplanes sp. GCM10030250 TaxID=3273376 RepID=UPI003607A357
MAAVVEAAGHGCPDQEVVAGPVELQVGGDELAAQHDGFLAFALLVQDFGERFHGGEQPGVVVLVEAAGGVVRVPGDVDLSVAVGEWRVQGAGADEDGVAGHPGEVDAAEVPAQ